MITKSEGKESNSNSYSIITYIDFRALFAVFYVQFPSDAGVETFEFDAVELNPLSLRSLAVFKPMLLSAVLEPIPQSLRSLAVLEICSCEDFCAFASIHDSIKFAIE